MQLDGSMMSMRADGSSGAARLAEPMVFVFHPGTGVRRIPARWLEGFRPSGFREATAAQVVAWHLERGLEPPPALVQASIEASGSLL